MQPALQADGVDTGAEPNDGNHREESEDNYAAGPSTGAPSARFVVSRRTIIVTAETRNSRKSLFDPLHDVAEGYFRLFITLGRAIHQRIF